MRGSSFAMPSRITMSGRMSRGCGFWYAMRSVIEGVRGLFTVVSCRNEGREVTEGNRRFPSVRLPAEASCRMAARAFRRAPPSIPAGARGGHRIRRRPAGEAADFCLCEIRHECAVGAEHDHLEALVDVALGELRARGVDAWNDLVAFAGLEDAIDGRDVLRLVVVHHRRKPQRECEVGRSDVDAV